MKEMDGYRTVVQFVAPSLGQILSRVDGKIQGQITEIRIKEGAPISLFTNQSLFLFPDGSLKPAANGGACPSKEEIRETFLRLCGYSVQSCEEKIKEGFFTLPGGHRVGICGRAVLKEGRISAIGDISSFNFRIASRPEGYFPPVLASLFLTRPFFVLIAGPPLSGKTSLLKGCIHYFSTKEKPWKTAVVDSREELGTKSGLCLPTVDFLEGYPRKEGMEIALRVLSPEVVVCDEISGNEDAKAIFSAVTGGVSVLASVHAVCLEDLLQKSFLKDLFSCRAITRIVFLDCTRLDRISQIISGEEIVG